MMRPRSAQDAGGTPRAPDGGGGSARREAKPPPAFHETYSAEPGSVSAARAALVRFARRCGMDAAGVDAVALAASEAVTNVVVHAYAERADPGRVEVSATLAGRELWVMVVDTGSGLRPRRDSPGLGLGLAIIARVADGVDLVRPSAGGLEIRMRFALGAGEAA